MKLSVAAVLASLVTSCLALSDAARALEIKNNYITWFAHTLDRPESTVICDADEIASTDVVFRSLYEMEELGPRLVAEYSLTPELSEDLERVVWQMQWAAEAKLPVASVLSRLQLPCEQEV